MVTEGQVWELIFVFSDTLANKVGPKWISLDLFGRRDTATAQANALYPIADAGGNKAGWTIFAGCNQRRIKIFLLLIWVRIFTLEFIACLKLTIIFFEKSQDKQEMIRVCLLGNI